MGVLVTAPVRETTTASAIQTEGGSWHGQGQIAPFDDVPVIMHGWGPLWGPMTCTHGWNAPIKEHVIELLVRNVYL